MSKTQPLVSVVVLNWRGTEDTLKCIASLGESTYKNIELILVDNESSADSLAALEDAIFPGTKKLVVNKQNLGFTGGQLSAYPHCDGDFILLLNNDAELDTKAISQAVETMQSDPKIAVVGGRSYMLDDDWAHQGAHFFSHQRIDPVTAEVTTYEKDDDELREVSNISGACVLIRRKAIEQCGYFDKRFFAYYEETDLFSRFRRYGWKIIYDPKVFLWHKHGASTKDKKYMYYFFMLKNQYLFAVKNFDSASLKLFKKTYYRNFRRSLKIYLKNFGHLQKSDYIHKARVMAFFYNLWRLPLTLRDRQRTLSINPGFSINDQFYIDNPLPVSILIDATTITKSQETRLAQNLERLSRTALKPAEVIVVSKKRIKVPQTGSLMRIANIVDKDLFDMRPLDFFMMTSNYDVLMLGTDAFLNDALSGAASAELAHLIKDIYTSMTGQELAAVVSRQQSSRYLSRRQFLGGKYTIMSLKKTFLVHFLADNSHLYQLDSSVLADMLGESIAHCHKVGALPINRWFGVEPGVIHPEKYPIITWPVRWNLKRILISLHIMIFIKLAYSLSTKPLRRHQVTAMEPKEKLVYSNRIPTVINTRDRYDPLMKLVKWLESTGHTRIMFVDNDSAYPPLLKYFSETKHQVVQLGRNGMHKSPWESFGVRFAAKDMPYIVTDPDIIPDKSCPKDALEYFVELLNKYPDVNKVGFGLRIDDLPDNFNLKEHVIAWEQRFWDKSLLLEKDVYAADIDTTLALYRPYTWWFLGPSARTGGKYVAKHEPWYQASDNPTEDFLYYTARANNKVSTWAFGKLPKHHLRALKREGFMPDYDDEDYEEDVKKDR